MSIRTRLVAIILLAVLLVMVASSALNLSLDIADMRDELRAETGTYVEVLAQDFAQLILLDRADRASDLVAKLAAFPKILQADLQDDSGRVLLRYQRPGMQVGVTEGDALRQGVFTEAGMAISVPVSYEQATLGQVVFLVSTDNLRKREVTAFRQTLLSLPLLLLLSIPVAMFMQRFFSRPLLILLQGMREAGSKGDYSLRLNSGETGEFGELHQGFNHMLAAMESSSKALYDQTERLQVALESIADGVITTDKQGRVDYMNPEAERLCGITLGQAAGMAAGSLLPIQERSGRRVPNPIKRCLETRSKVVVKEDCELRRKRGGPLAVQVSVAPILDRDRQLSGTITAVMDLSHARAMTEELNFRANHDALTGLINRFAFDLELKDALKGVNDREEQHALLYMDLDQFKVVNDTCGHPVGDELLKEVGSLLRSKVRSGDCLSRLGGDEFGLILKHCPLQRALDIAEEIRAMIEDYRFSWGEQVFDVGISIGATLLHKDVGSQESVLADADAACYEAKEAGRNKVYLYQDSDAAMSHRKGQMALVSQIRQAIDTDRLVLYAQPIEPLQHDEPADHYEVLVRMLDERDNPLPPAKFLGAAERYGLIEQLDRWVLTKVLEQLDRHPAHVAQLSLCSINLSGASLGRPEFLHTARQLLAGYPALRGKLCFEITETVAISSMANARTFIEGLQDYEVRFALDDFGTGMSSLSYLKLLPVDLVKIDGAFVRDMLDDSADRALVVAMNNIAHELGKATVAEFVENAEIKQALRDIGVDYAQGYHLGKPRPLTELLDSVGRVAG